MNATAKVLQHWEDSGYGAITRLFMPARVGDTQAAQVYEFACARTGRLYIAQPPPHLSASWLLAQSLSRVLGSPVTLPLHTLLACPPAEMQVCAACRKWKTMCAYAGYQKKHLIAFYRLAP